MIVPVALGVLSLVLLLGRSYGLLCSLIVAGGWLQSSLTSWTHDTSWLYLDDVPVMVLVLAAIIKAASSGKHDDRRGLLAYLVIVALAALEVVRAPEFGVGVSEAREMVVPIGLIFAGYVLRDRIPWDRLLQFCLVVAFATATWVVAEYALQRPLMDPIWYYLNGTGASAQTLRNGPQGPLPLSYYADKGFEQTIFRPGGPYMNPPITGFMLGIGGYAATRRTTGFWRIVLLAAIGLALWLTYARVGILLFLACVAYLCWRSLGRGVAIAGMLACAAYLARVFASQGNTDSHATGLISGLATGLKHPLGMGFGHGGYQSVLAGGVISNGQESLLGLYAAWGGWIIIASSVWVAVRLVRRLLRLPLVDSLTAWVALGFFAAILLSESSSAIASTPVLWLTLGAAAITSSKRSAAFGPAANTHESRRPDAESLIVEVRRCGPGRVRALS
jgi:hypothetical protein